MAQMAGKFSQEDVFPIIARLIQALHQTQGDYVPHGDLVDALLKDAMGKALVDAALAADTAEKSKEWWASNMVQWFSERITENKSAYQSQFERKKIKGAWACRPRA